MARLAIALLIVVASVIPTTAGELRLREGRSVARGDWTDRVERSRQESARYVGAAVDAFRMRGMKRSDHAPAPANVPLTYLDDPTLRYGDVIAIEGRLIVFRGAGLPLPHRTADFQEIGQAGTLGGIHDRELRSIDRLLARDSPAAR